MFPNILSFIICQLPIADVVIGQKKPALEKQQAVSKYIFQRQPGWQCQLWNNRRILGYERRKGDGIMKMKKIYREVV